MGLERGISMRCRGRQVKGALRKCLRSLAFAAADLNKATGFLPGLENPSTYDFLGQKHAKRGEFKPATSVFPLFPHVLSRFQRLRPLGPAARQLRGHADRQGVPAQGPGGQAPGAAAALRGRRGGGEEGQQLAADAAKRAAAGGRGLGHVPRW